MPLDPASRNRLLQAKDKVIANFGQTEWQEAGVVTGWIDRINSHSRLLRSLDWGDQDYGGNVIAILSEMQSQDPQAFVSLEGYLREKFPEESVYASAKPKERRITFSPDVFNVPEGETDPNLVSVMMSFDPIHLAVFQAIQQACPPPMLCKRGDDVWNQSVIIQDVFELIYRSAVVISDFTGKNPNVMYETGIAHTLGKLVIPITQSMNDVPFDLHHHRCILYSPDRQGLELLRMNLAAKLSTVIPPNPFQF